MCKEDARKTMATAHVQFPSLGWVTPVVLSRADYLPLPWSLECPGTMDWSMKYLNFSSQRILGE